MFKLLVIVILVFWLNVGCQSNQVVKGIDGKLKQVVSGQTIEVIIDIKTYKLRLAGLDTPSFSIKPWGENAQQFLQKTLIPNTLLLIETDVEELDKFGRISGYVWYNQQLINQQIIEQGYGVANLAYTDGKYDRQLLHAQDYARIMGKGIWNPEQPLKQLNSSSQSSSQ